MPNPIVTHQKLGHTYIWHWDKDDPDYVKHVLDDVAFKTLDNAYNLDMFDGLILAAKMSEINIDQHKEESKTIYNALDALDAELNKLIDKFKDM